jgi:hypothetical protein
VGEFYLDWGLTKWKTGTLYSNPCVNFNHKLKCSDLKGKHCDVDTVMPVAFRTSKQTFFVDAF